MKRSGVFVLFGWLVRVPIYFSNSDNSKSGDNVNYSPILGYDNHLQHLASNLYLLVVPTASKKGSEGNYLTGSSKSGIFLREDPETEWQNMKQFLADKRYVHHLGAYAIWMDDDGSIKYVTSLLPWKSQNLLLLRGDAWKFGDVLALGREQEERETTNSIEEIRTELERHPRWDKTKYYCLIHDYVMLGLMYYCESSECVNEESEDYQIAEGILRHYGIKRRVRSRL